MKRITIEGDWQRSMDDNGWAVRRIPTDGSLSAFLVIPDYMVTAVEDIPDPLPTEPGAVIEATLLRGPRVRLMRTDHRAEVARWQSASGSLYSGDEITDWKLLLPGVTA